MLKSWVNFHPQRTGRKCYSDVQRRLKADRMRIVIIFVPSIQPINHSNVCDSVYFTAHFYKQYCSNNAYDINTACLLLLSVTF